MLEFKLSVSITAKQFAMLVHALVLLLLLV